MAADEETLNSTAESFKGEIVPIHRARSPQALGELLTLREAMARFGLYPQQIYAAAARGLLHPVRPNGRVLYPEWELAKLTFSYTRAA